MRGTEAKMLLIQESYRVSITYYLGVLVHIVPRFNRFVTANDLLFQLFFNEASHRFLPQLLPVFQSSLGT